jgi:uncharacterized repeat protein (TIGR01451 family)
MNTSIKLKFLSFAALLVVGWALALSNASSALAQGPEPIHFHVTHTTKWFDQHRAHPAVGADPSPTANMTYHGGTVELTLNTYTIFWAPPPYSIPADYQNLINRYFQDIGGSRFYNINTQYFQNPGPTYIQNSSTYADTWYDTSNPFPHAGTTADPLLGTDILNEVINVSLARHWPGTATNTMFFVFTPKDIESCQDASKGSCTPKTANYDPDHSYCAYHAWWTPDGSHFVVFANMPYVETWTTNCRNFSASPNGNLDADAEISQTSHEHFEAATDAFQQAWYDSNLKGEDGDKCAYHYGAISSDGTNIILKNNHSYIMQLEWSNQDNDGTPYSGCVKAYPKPYNADLVVFQGHGPEPVPAGSMVTFGIDPNNGGPDDAQGVVLMDAIPANTTFQSLSVSPGWLCSTPPIGGTGNVSCNVPTEVPFDAGSFSLNVKVNPSTPSGTILSNTATMSSKTNDPNASNNSITENATVSCGAPQQPQLVSPANGEKKSNKRVLLSWNAANCATTYNVIVNQDSKNGPTVDQQSNLTVTQYKTVRLPVNHTYFWRVESCNGALCKQSKFRSFIRIP